MYLKEIRITNVRSIEEVEWVVLPKKMDGWHVIIGDNGSGKSTFLRSIALALIGIFDAGSLRQPWMEWLRHDELSGIIQLGVQRDELADPRLSADVNEEESTLEVKVKLWRERLGKDSEVFRNRWSLFPDRKEIWEAKSGWFCAAFGPYRRLTGGDSDSTRISKELPRLARFLSIFDERYALSDCIEWLQKLRFQQLEEEGGDREGPSGGGLLDAIKAFVNQSGFLPHQVRLTKITSDSVFFVDGNGMEVAIENLSDGYRSILSMTFELIRQLSIAYGPDRVFDTNDPTRVICPGVVLIDEVDIHLHPTWQRQIGLFFRKHFPKIQFIVTTHSPLLCQAADVGTVFVLPKPGEKGRGEMLEGAKLERLLYGNVLDAYGTEVFGRDVTRSDEAKKMRKRLAALNVKETREGLTQKERREQLKLRGAMPTSAMSRDPGDDPDS